MRCSPRYAPRQRQSGSPWPAWLDRQPDDAGPPRALIRSNGCERRSSRGGHHATTRASAAKSKSGGGLRQNSTRNRSIQGSIPVWPPRKTESPSRSTRWALVVSRELVARVEASSSGEPSDRDRVRPLPARSASSPRGRNRAAERGDPGQKGWSADGAAPLAGGSGTSTKSM